MSSNRPEHGRETQPNRTEKVSPSTSDLGGIRLQKVLAQAGLGSRRACEELISAGRVEVDGAVVRELGTRVDPQRQHIRVDGGSLPRAQEHVYLALHKPQGMVSTMSDERGRPCVGDLVADRSSRLFHVGRLDAESTGLLLLTNDGDLAQRLTHPTHGVSKTYLAEVDGLIRPASLRELRRGVALEDGPASVDSARVVQTSPGRSLVEVVLHEGRTHIVRRLMAAVGHPVRSLGRTAIGPLGLGSLRPGRTRHLTKTEVNMLYKASEPPSAISVKHSVDTAARRRKPSATKR